MQYTRIDPAPDLEALVREYWIAESPDTEIVRQKIIPDGYFEVIFRYGAPYRINLHGQWETQTNMLLAGQISGHFFIENTGTTGMIGIKLQPAAAFELFGKSMDRFKDRVVDLREVLAAADPLAEQLVADEITADARSSLAAQWVKTIAAQKLAQRPTRIVDAIRRILEEKGMVDIATLAANVHVSQRHLEREFKKVVGLTPKFYCRIVRFNHIFALMQEGGTSWIDVALRSGHFDQSHFIKNFKAFTGEKPADYGFDEDNMANFFLQREQK